MHAEASGVGGIRNAISAGILTTCWPQSGAHASKTLVPVTKVGCSHKPLLMNYHGDVQELKLILNRLAQGPRQY